MISFLQLPSQTNRQGFIIKTKTVTKKNDLPLISQSTCLMSQFQRLSERSDRICSSASLGLLLGPQVKTTNMQRSMSSLLQTMMSFKPYMISQGTLFHLKAGEDQRSCNKRLELFSMCFTNML